MDIEPLRRIIPASVSRMTKGVEAMPRNLIHSLALAICAVFVMTAAAQAQLRLPQYEGFRIIQRDMIDRETGQSIGPIGPGGRYANPIPRATVAYNGARYEPGDIIIDTSERRLYYVLDQRRAIRYGVGVGREGFGWAGVEPVSQKREWPDWIPPEEMRKRQPDLPVRMAGGPDNPLGARAIYLGNTLYRIHGSNEPWTIGEAVSSGCFRMTNEDVIDLYERVKIGATVHVL